MSDALFQVKNLKQHFYAGHEGIFGGKKKFIYALDGVSFEIQKGETLGLVGESGCGKSTVVRTSSLLYKPTSGSILLNGKDLTKMNAREMFAARKDMQLVFQDPYSSLDPRMTTFEIIAEPIRIYKSRGLLQMAESEIQKHVEHLMELVGLSKFFKNRFPHEFSGGQRQRIGIARSLALRPQLILADEPVSALDVSIQAQVLNLFKDIQKEMRLSYLFIAHDLAVIKYISDRIAVMYLGKIVETGGYKELYDNPLHPYTKALLSAVPVPDPRIERKRERIILHGDVPSPDTQRAGCYFYDRCPQHMEKCKVSQPDFFAPNENKKNHSVACFLYQK